MNINNSELDNDMPSEYNFRAKDKTTLSESV